MSELINRIRSFASSLTGRLVSEKLAGIPGLDPMVSSLFLQRVSLLDWGSLRKAFRQYAKQVASRQSIDLTGRKRRNFLARINGAGDKIRVIYVTSQAPLLLSRQSSQLRETGQYEVFVLTNNPWMSDRAGQYFDGLYSFATIAELTQLLSGIEKGIVHVRGAIFNATYWGVLACLLCKTKVVFEFYDLASYMFSWADASLFWSPSDVTLERFSEAYVCQHADGIMHGYSEEGERSMRSTYASKCPMLEFYPYVHEAFVGSAEERLSKRNGRIHLVYAGNVEASFQPKELFGDVQFLPLADRITSQGIEYHILIPPYRSEAFARKVFSDYFEFAEKNPLFRFEYGKPVDELNGVLSRYDFGLMLYPFDRVRVRREHYDWRLPGKFFTYLEAGVPIVVSEELRYVAEVVRMYRLGVVIAQEEIPRLHEILISVDRDRLAANVREAARGEMSFGRHLRRLAAFYRSVHDGPIARKGG